MNLTPRNASLLSLLLPSVIVAACGGNVVVDGMSGTTGSASNGGAGGAPASSSMIGVGASVGVASSNGGSFGVGVGTSTASVSSSSSVATVSVSASSTSASSSSGAAGACTQGSDPMELANPGLNGILTKCAEQNLGNNGGLSKCLAAQTDLSSGCVACLGTFVGCAEMHCLTVCAPPNTASAACASCEGLNCQSAFATCSGQSIQP